MLCGLIMNRDRFLPFLFLLSLISTCIEIDLSVPSFPDIAAFFQVSEGFIQSTITINFLGYCIGALLYGPLSDCYGRRKMMLLGNVFLTIGAIGCVFAPSVPLLLLARLIQGFGASASVVLVFTMIADLYKGEKAMKLIGTMNASLAIIMIVAPILGGFINQAIGWRGSYGCVAGISVLTWILLFILLPESKTQFESFNAVKIYSDYRKLFNSRRFLTAAMIPSLFFAAYMSYIAVSSFLYMLNFGLSMYAFVIHQAIIVSAFSITSIYIGKIIRILGPINMVRYGVGLALMGSLFLIGTGFEKIASPYWVTFFMSVFSIGFAMCYPIIFGDSLSVFPEASGPASSFIMGSRAMLVTLATGIMSMVFTGQVLTFALPFSIGVILSVMLAISWLGGQAVKMDTVEA